MDMFCKETWINLTDKNNDTKGNGLNQICFGVLQIKTGMTKWCIRKIKAMNRRSYQTCQNNCDYETLKTFQMPTSIASAYLYISKINYS